MDLPDWFSGLTSELTQIIDIDNLAQVSPVVLLFGVAVLLFIESGFLLGLATPGNSLPITMGVLVAGGAIDVVPAVIAVATGSAAGAQWAFRRSKVTGTAVFPEYIETRLPKFVIRLQDALIDSIDKRPRLTALCTHPIGAIRTIAPRMLAAGALRYRDFALINTIVALSWATGLVTVGAIIGQSSTFRTIYSFLWIPAVVFLVVSLVRRHHTRVSERQPTGVCRDPLFSGVGGIPDTSGASFGVAGAEFTSGSPASADSDCQVSQS